MTTDLKSEIRERMRSTGEKYTTTRRNLLAERTASSLKRVTIHATNNGLSLDEETCGAMTVAGRQCRNPFIHGQFWPGGHREALLKDGSDTRMLAQKRCRVHVDHTIPAEVVLVMDDVDFSPFPGPFPGPIWQDPQALAAIRAATTGSARAETLSLYVTLSETTGGESLQAIAERAGLHQSQIEAAVEVLTALGLFCDGVLVA